MRNAVAALLALLIIAGYTSGSSVSQSVSCPSLIDPQSSLAADVSRFKSPPKCESLAIGQGMNASVYMAAGYIKPGKTEHLLIAVWHVDDRVTEWDPIDTSRITGDIGQATAIPGYIKAHLGSYSVDASVIKMEIAKMQSPSSCLAADSPGHNHTKVRTIVCRAIEKTSNDTAVISKANQIAQEDFPAIQP